MKIMLTIVLWLFPLAIGSQEPTVYMHGGSAEDIVNKCDERPGPALSYCFGYILGIADMHNALNAILPSPKDNTYCLPDNASASQMAKIVAKFGRDHNKVRYPQCVQTKQRDLGCSSR